MQNLRPSTTIDKIKLRRLLDLALDELENDNSHMAQVYIEEAMGVL